MGYQWTQHQAQTYTWTGFWFWLFGAKPRWTNPTSDVQPGTRFLKKGNVQSSIKVQWPAELKDLSLGLEVKQKPWQGTVSGGKPVQMVSDTKTKGFSVDNIYGGLRYKDGVPFKDYKAGERYTVSIPVPLRDGWGIEGYPNASNTGDRHWYGIEADGTAHEVIWMGIGTPTVLNYTKYAPDGSLLDGIMTTDEMGTYPRGAVKGHQQWTSLAWNKGDEPHVLGIVFKALGNNPVNGDGDSPEPYASWALPAYGQTYRLSEAEYDRQMALGPDQEQANFLSSLRFHGVESYDQGKQTWHGSIGMIAGAQQANNTVANLDIPISELELVTG